MHGQLARRGQRVAPKHSVNGALAETVTARVLGSNPSRLTIIPRSAPTFPGLSETIGRPFDRHVDSHGGSIWWAAWDASHGRKTPASSARLPHTRVAAPRGRDARHKWSDRPTWIAVTSAAGLRDGDDHLKKPNDSFRNHGRSPGLSGRRLPQGCRAQARHQRVDQPPAGLAADQTGRSEECRPGCLATATGPRDGGSCALVGVARRLHARSVGISCTSLPRTSGPTSHADGMLGSPPQSTRCVKDENAQRDCSD